MRQLSSVAGDDALVGLIVVALCGDLVQDRYDENSSLPHTGFCLAEDILSLKGLRDGVDLNLTGVFKAAFSNCSFQLIFQEQLIPARKVGTCILLFVNSWLLFVRAFIVREYVVHGV